MRFTHEHTLRMCCCHFIYSTQFCVKKTMQHRQFKRVRTHNKIMKKNHSWFIAFIEHWINGMKWKMCGLLCGMRHTGWMKNKWSKKCGQEYLSNFKCWNGFRCCFQQKEQQQQQKIDTHSCTKSMVRIFFLHHSQCYVRLFVHRLFCCLILSSSSLVLSCTLLYLYLMMFGRHNDNGGDVAVVVRALQITMYTHCA